jgi:hypothetical protein
MPAKPVRALRTRDLLPPAPIARQLRRAGLAFGYGMPDGRVVLVVLRPLRRGDIDCSAGQVRTELPVTASRADVAAAWSTLAGWGALVAGAQLERQQRAVDSYVEWATGGKGLPADALAAARGELDE